MAHVGPPIVKTICCCEPTPVCECIESTTRPSSLLADLSGIDLSGCTGDSCSPSVTSVVLFDVSDGFSGCIYEAEADVCINGILCHVELVWAAHNAGLFYPADPPSCKWAIAVYRSDFSELLYVGVGGVDATDPTGTYTRDSGCGTGSVVVS
jgi:hypothetical protein